jgi:Phosphodiester glycosidase
VDNSIVAGLQGGPSGAPLMLLAVLVNAGRAIGRSIADVDESEMRKRLYLALFACVVLIATPLAWVYARNGFYGLNVVLRRGGSIWPLVARDDPRLTPAVRLALHGAVGAPGPLTWAEPRPGFEVGELPIVVAYGPSDYQSSHGAFVASADGASVVDLRDRDWRPVFAGKDNGMVSYPLLVDASGKSRAVPSKWLAGRSFVGQDQAGRIVVGTTADAFLSLDRFANLLRAAPLDLALALNLDGGPVACQAIDLGAYQRKTCGPLELQVDEDKVSLLQPLIGGNGWALPIVLAVAPR